MTTPPIPLKKPYRRQIKLPQLAAPLNIVVTPEGVSISVASYGQYCKITWWQIIKVMAPPMYSDHNKAIDHLKDQVAMYKTKLATNAGNLKKKKKDNKKDKIDHAAVWKQLLDDKLSDGRPLGQLLARKELLQTLQSTDPSSET